MIFICPIMDVYLDQLMNSILIYWHFNIPFYILKIVAIGIIIYIFNLHCLLELIFYHFTYSVVLQLFRSFMIHPVIMKLPYVICITYIYTYVYIYTNIYIHICIYNTNIYKYIIQIYM